MRIFLVNLCSYHDRTTQLQRYIQNVHLLPIANHSESSRCISNESKENQKNNFSLFSLFSQTWTWSKKYINN